MLEVLKFKKCILNGIVCVELLKPCAFWHTIILIARQYFALIYSVLPVVRI